MAPLNGGAFLLFNDYLYNKRRNTMSGRRRMKSKKAAAEKQKLIDEALEAAKKAKAAPKRKVAPKRKAKKVEE